MKQKIIKLIFILLFLIIIYNIYKLTIIKHDSTYKVNNLEVKEYYNKKNKSHYYNFIIKKNKNTYIYTINNNFHKKKKIIKKIELYTKNNLECIIPIYKKDIEKNIYCNLDNKQVSIDYLQKSNNNDFKEIKNKIKNKDILFPNSKTTKAKYENLEIYKENLAASEKMFIWNYRGIYILDNKSVTYKKILEYDLYDNLMVTLTDDYYVLFENNSVNGIKNVHYYNIKKNKLKKYEIKDIVLDKDSYINGVYDNLIYITDNKNKKQYTLNLKKRKVEEVDNEQTSYIVYKGNKKKLLSKSDFFMNKQYFTTEKYNGYYYKKTDNKLYKVKDNYNKNPILLFEIEDIKEWTTKKDEVILLCDNTIYLYDDNFGLRKILTSNELKYNYKDIYQLWRK